MQEPKNDRVTEFFEVCAGALTYGAEKAYAFSKRAFRQAKIVWNKHENEREEIKKTLVSYKEKFLAFLESKGHKNVDFDAIVSSLENLSDEELNKLKEILKNL